MNLSLCLGYCPRKTGTLKEPTHNSLINLFKIDILAIVRAVARPAIPFSFNRHIAFPPRWLLLAPELILHFLLHRFHPPLNQEWQNITGYNLNQVKDDYNYKKGLKKVGNI